MNTWLAQKKEEWINIQKGQGNEVDIEEVNKLEQAKDKLPPWIQEIVTKHAGDIQSKFEEILNLKFLIAQVGTRCPSR